LQKLVGSGQGRNILSNSRVFDRYSAISVSTVGRTLHLVPYRRAATMDFESIDDAYRSFDDSMNCLKQLAKENYAVALEVQQEFSARNLQLLEQQKLRGYPPVTLKWPVLRNEVSLEFEWVRRLRVRTRNKTLPFRRIAQNPKRTYYDRVLRYADRWQWDLIREFMPRVLLIMRRAQVTSNAHKRIGRVKYDLEQSRLLDPTLYGIYEPPIGDPISRRSEEPDDYLLNEWEDVIGDPISRY